ncbi:hypothetical protein [Escherichia phage EC1-UPM]|uniref:Uncharacterized protein n=1 Tax=Escherichia phage EC1-UPM TaxID=1258572 RepID=M9PKA9_9CAUD|nr:hypothetical protein FDH23_gp52 [Escherichia phage EC1-UPM]AGC31561.1 hypothetical protein [Escherichia phage EC1-UPM]
MQIILNQSEVEAAVQAYVDDQINLAGDVNIVINADGTTSVGINEEVHEDTPPVGVEKKTRRSRKNPQEAKHRPVEPEPEETVEEVKVEETQTSTGGPNGNSTPEPEEEAVIEPEAQEEVVQKEDKAEEPAEKPATKPSLFAGLKRS